MAKNYLRRPYLNGCSGNNIAPTATDGAAGKARRLEGLPAIAKSGRLNRLGSRQQHYYRIIEHGNGPPRMRVIETRRDLNSNSRYTHGPMGEPTLIRNRAVVMTADLMRRSALQNVDLAISLIVRLARAQSLICVDEDIFTIRGLLSDAHDVSKSIILLRSCHYPAIRHQQFIRALQVGNLARMMLGIQPFMALKSTQPSNVAEAGQHIPPHVASNDTADQ